jgi:hypothetical protein
MRHAVLLSGILVVAAARIASAAECPKGFAGTWSVFKDVVHTTEVPAGQLSQTFAMPQAQCHPLWPHCGPNEGDFHDYYAQSPRPDIVLRNPRVACVTIACVFDHQSVTPVSDTLLHVEAWSHSGEVTLQVTADMVQIIRTTSHDRSAIGPLAFDQEVSIAMDSAATVTLGLYTPLGNATLTAADLQANRIPDWVQVTAASSKRTGPPAMYKIKIGSKDCRS